PNVNGTGDGTNGGYGCAAVYDRLNTGTTADQRPRKEDSPVSQSVMMDRVRVEEAVTRFFHMCNSHCPGNVAPLLTADVELIDRSEVRGHEDVHTYLVWLWQRYPDLTFRVEHVLVDGHLAAAEVTAE